MTHHMQSSGKDIHSQVNTSSTNVMRALGVFVLGVFMCVCDIKSVVWCRDGIITGTSQDGNTPKWTRYSLRHRGGRGEFTALPQPES